MIDKSISDVIRRSLKCEPHLWNWLENRDCRFLRHDDGLHVTYSVDGWHARVGEKSIIGYLALDTRLRWKLDGMRAEALRREARARKEAETN